MAQNSDLHIVGVQDGWKNESLECLGDVQRVTWVTVVEPSLVSMFELLPSVPGLPYQRGPGDRVSLNLSFLSWFTH